MWLLFKIGLRNIIRNKGRNILLGLAIGFGMMILVVANSFSRGISDTLINKIIIYVSGHIDFVFVEKGKFRSPITREKERFGALIKKNVTGIKDMYENLSLFGRVIGKGKSDNLALVGWDEADSQDLTDFFKVIDGNPKDIFNKNITNPVVLATSKAKYLNVKMFDVLRARMQNVHGQHQTGILTVVAIVKSRNVFMDMAVFVSNKNIKKLMGLRPFESGSLQIILEDPKTAVDQADKLHSVANPEIAAILGKVSNGRVKSSATTLTFFRDEESISLLKKNISLIQGSIKKVYSSEAVMLSQFLARKLNAHIGDKITLTYPNQYLDKVTERQYTVNGIFVSKRGVLPRDTLLLGDKLFYKTYYSNLPKRAVYEQKLRGFSKISKAMGSEWKLLPRSSNFDEFKKKIKDFSAIKSYVAALDVRTMHETASNILKMEKILNLITFLAVLVMFFIILIGVVNSLRMTIRERTREIGTIRAIGMQKKDVRRLIVIETFLLSLFSSIGGVILAFILMGLSRFWIIKAEGMLGILIVNSRLHFLPSAVSIILNMVLILVIAIFTAYFPARHAANLSAADALRHYE